MTEVCSTRKERVSVCRQKNGKRKKRKGKQQKLQAVGG
jgi:hypothetical protein